MAAMSSPDCKEQSPSLAFHTEEVKEQQHDVPLDYAGARIVTGPAEKKLRLKLDLIILPTLALMYFLNFLDRTAITVAQLDGIQKELKLSSVQYQTCVSGLFIGYLLGQVPSSV